MMRVGLTVLGILSIATAARAAELPRWSQGTWADNTFATCRELNSPSVFKDGGFVYIHGSEIGGHEWSCRAVGKTSSGEYSLDCGGEGDEWAARARFQKSGRGMIIRWTGLGQDQSQHKTEQYPTWCRKGAPAFWNQ